MSVKCQVAVIFVVVAVLSQHLHAMSFSRSGSRYVCNCPGTPCPRYFTCYNSEYVCNCEDCSCYDKDEPQVDMLGGDNDFLSMLLRTGNLRGSHGKRSSFGDYRENALDDSRFAKQPFDEKFDKISGKE